jgi:hypothetical protein
MKRLSTGLLVVFAIALSTDCFADPAGLSPEQVARAERFFHEGTQAFEAAQYAQAYKALKTAWELAPTYRTAAGLGQVELQLEQYPDAAFHLAYCLRHYPADADPAARTHVEEGLDQARAHVGALRVRVSVEGAEVSVDGAAIGKSPLEGLVFVKPGSHVIAATHEGYRSAEEAFDAPVRATRDVTLSLTVEHAAVAPPAGPPQKSPEPAPAEVPKARSDGLSPTAWVLIVGGSLTAAALATTIVFDVKGAAADDDLKAAKGELQPGSCADPSGPDAAACEHVKSLADTRNTDNQIAVLGAIATGVLAAATAGTALYVHSREHAAKESAHRPFVRFSAGLSGGAFVVGSPF